MSKIRPIKNNILFQFLPEEVIKIQGKKAFKTITPAGVHIISYDDATKQPRWGTVLYVGPEVKDTEVRPGMKILIEPLKWTYMVIFNNTPLWMTRPEFVIGVDDNVPPQVLIYSAS
ncbi:MAG: hypothetical protein ACREAU_03145 [Nitrosopumilaceae archaeon]